ncbi:hypothetical protein [Syntrophaceticus schinkii]|uniref:hypothetical protein n=1 Tax=Syntrophaceticus schinkii TaxID=499207 RepID=UPI0018DBC01F|nr:hypothetical protein [Syntrophaceticus schinkii]
MKNSASGTPPSNWNQQPAVVVITVRAIISQPARCASTPQHQKTACSSALLNEMREVGGWMWEKMSEAGDLGIGKNA